MAKKQLVSIVVTTRNESKNISALLDSLLIQSYSHFEIVIVDANSTDQTRDEIKKYQLTTPRIRLIVAPGNRSVGRNIGISSAKSDFIAITDAGCVADKDWIKQMVLSINSTNCDFVAGYYQGVGSNHFEKALIPYVLVMPDKTDQNFLASTRSMLLRKSIWEKSGGFNEQIDPSEDYEFSLRLKKLGYRSTFNPKALVYWRPNRNFVQSLKMFYNFANSDSFNQLPRPKVKTIFARYLIGGLIGTIYLPAGMFCLFIYIVWSIFKSRAYVKEVKSTAWLPVIQIGSDFAVMIGTIVGQTRRMYREYAK